MSFEDTNDVCLMSIVATVAFCLLSLSVSLLHGAHTCYLHVMLSLLSNVYSGFQYEAAMKRWNCCFEVQAEKYSFFFSHVVVANA